MPENAPNITIYVSPVSTELALALAAAESIAKPERVVYVFGTADDVAPNFTTVAGAITYANSLTPISTEPVVVRLFTKADGTPYDLAGLSSWTTYANQYIYFVSDFVRLNETTTLPTTLPVGAQVWYIDANGVETLWVGREDGSAWPAVGYKEYVAILEQSGTNAPTATVISNTFGTVAWAYNSSGTYSAPLASSPQLKIVGNITNQCFTTEYFITLTPTANLITLTTFNNAGSNSNDILGQIAENRISIRVYP